MYTVSCTMGLNRTIFELGPIPDKSFMLAYLSTHDQCILLPQNNNKQYVALLDCTLITT